MKQELSQKEINRRRRVLNALHQTQDRQFNPRQMAIRKLLRWQPGAQQIRFVGRCDTSRCRSQNYLSYRLLDFEEMTNGKQEDCGYYCPACDFTGAGRRDIRERKNVMVTQAARKYLESLRVRKPTGAIGFFHTDHHSED